MKAYVFQKDRKIEPFDEPARNCLVLNQTIAKLQAEVFSKMGIEMVPVSDILDIFDFDEYLLLGDNLYFTPELLSEFIAESRRQNSVTICALKSGITTQRTAVSVQEVETYQGYTEYNLRYFPKSENRKNFRTVMIDPDEFFASFGLPNHICGTKEYLVPMTDKFVIQIDHWVNLWVANIGAILAGGARLKKSSKIKLLFLALKARSFNKWKILSRLNKIGKNCDIHPTAYIEGSLIGNNVVVGAGAVIREAVIGDDCFIGNSVCVEESVIGERSTILNGHILYSVFYPGSSSGAEYIGASLVGRDTFIGSNVTLTDFRFDGKNVTVLKNGVAVDSGNVFLGSCLGHRVYLGSGYIGAPGRMVPCGLRIALCKEKTACINSEGQIFDDFNEVKN